MAKVFDDNGAELDATFHVERQSGDVTVLFESRGGRRGGPDARNVDYNAGLRLLLERLGEAGAVLQQVLVDSRTTRDRPASERHVEIDGFEYPLDLSTVPDFEALRVAIGRGQARVGRDPSARGGGNPNKQIRLVVEVVGVDEWTLAKGTPGATLLLDVLAEENDEIRPANVKVHFATTPPGDTDGPLDAYYASNFEEWQSWQSKKNFERPYIMALISLPDHRWLFAGLFRRLDVEDRTVEGRKWKYKTEPVESDLAGRLIVSWKRLGQQSYRLGEAIHSELQVETVLTTPVAGAIPSTDASSRGHRPPRVSAADQVQSVRIDVEAHNAQTFGRAGTEPTAVERRESELVKRFEAHLEAEGEEVGRYRVRAKGQVRWMFTDTVVLTRSELVEAKASSGRSAVREAIGQLFDYRRLITPRPERLTVLLPNQPVDDLLDLLSDLGISSVWESEPGVFRRHDA